MAECYQNLFIVIFCKAIMSKFKMNFTEEEDAIMDELVKKGLFETKNDVIITAIDRLGEKYGITKRFVPKKF